MAHENEAFIQEPTHRPNPSLSQEAQGIPLIDLSSPDVDTLVDDIRPACRQWGFFQIINHVVQYLHRVEEAAWRFFHLSLVEKRRFRRDARKVLGYYDTEHTRSVQHWKEVFDYTVNEPTLATASMDEDDKRVAYRENHRPQRPPE